MQGSLERALILDLSGNISAGEREKPAKSIFCPIQSFFLEIAMPWVLQLVRTCLTRSNNIGLVGAQIKISSTIFWVSGTETIVRSDFAQNTSFVEQRPMGPRRYLNLPCGKRKVVKCLDFSSRGI